MSNDRCCSSEIEVLFVSNDNLTVIRWFDFLKYEGSDPQYVSFRFELKTPTFMVKTKFDSDIREIIRFKNELKHTRGNRLIKFRPLGEYLLVNIETEGVNRIIVSGDISDMQMPQSSLSFSFEINNEMVISLTNGLETVCKYLSL